MLLYPATSPQRWRAANVTHSDVAIRTLTNSWSCLFNSRSRSASSILENKRNGRNRMIQIFLPQSADLKIAAARVAL
ncbi:hypothetical protein E2C01_100872 [Portunus trituberculatus]|uniref:Uncharacterized protein n=1 Tax=Portunus trituberculatus TaxID=210409 RepID=A0A5B7K487_PORTR|nr:hypothetical protein [Portunus trituberculatus]